MTQTTPKKAPAKSRVSNGNALLPDIDGRSVWARRYRDVMDAHIADTGGDAYLSEAQRSIIRRAAALTVEIERLEAGWAQAGGCNDMAALDAHQRAAGNLRRLLEAIGLERKQRDVTPALSDYIRG